MASELVIVFQGDATLYAMLRRRDDAWPWNVALSAFAAWDEDDLNDYAISLTNRAGDLYQGDWPNGVAAGRYKVLYYRQAGEAPSSDDLLLDAAEVDWNGASVSEGDDATPDDGDLVNLATVKAYLRIDDSSNDLLLARLITQVSARIERLCGRSFHLRLHNLHTRPRNRNIDGSRLFLPNYPVASVERIAYGCAPALRLTLDASYLRGSVTVANAMLRISSIAGDGSLDRQEIDFAEAGTTNLLAVAISELDGWSAQALVNIPCQELIPFPPLSAVPGDFTLAYAPTAIDHFTLKPESGVITLWPGVPGIPRVGRLNVFIAYLAGYAVIPPDIQIVACELIAEAFHLGIRDGNLREERLGDYSQTLASAANVNAGRLERLRPYMSLPLPTG